MGRHTRGRGEGAGRRSSGSGELPFVVFSLDKDGVFTASEGGGLAALGLEPGEVVGRSAFEVYRGDPAVLENLERALSGESFAAEVEVSAAVFSCLYAPLRDGQGGVVGAMGLAAEAGELLTMAEDARPRERALAASSEGIVITDPNLPDDPIVYANPAFEGITGYPAGEALGRNCRFLQGEGDRDQPDLEELRAALREGRGCRVVLRNRKKDGTPFWNELSVSPVFDEGGRLANFVGVQNDVTGRRRMEGALRESEERLRVAMGAARLGTFDFDPSTGELSWDERCKEIFGLPPDAEVGYDAFLARLHPDDRARTDEAVRRSLDPAGGGGYETEYRVVGTGDSAAGRWVEARGRTSFEYGRAVRLIGTVADVTGRKEAEGRDRLLADLDRALRPLADPGEVMATAARLLAEHLGADRCAYAEVEADEDHFRITGDYARGDTPGIAGRFAMSEFGTEALGLMRVGEPYVVADAEADARVSGTDLTAYRRTGIRAVVSVPLRKGGRFAAGMAVHQRTPRRWAPEEVGLVRAVAERCWEATERARAERSLRESEERFRATFEAAGVGMAHVEPDGRWLRMNGKLPEITGYPKEELLSLTFQDITHPEDLSEDLEHFRRLRLGEIEAYSMEKRYVRKDGRRVWITLTRSALRASSGEISCFVSVIEEVTTRKLAELVPDPLTGRELEILSLVAKHRTNEEIAASLRYSEGMIRHHVGSVLKKLGVKKRVRAAERAVEIGLIPPPR